MYIDETDSDDTPKSYTITETDDREEENSSGSENEETKELNTLYEIITEQGYEIEKLNIERLFRLGFDRYELVVDGFIRKYLENQERDDKDVQKSLMQYLAKKGYREISDKKSDEFNESDNVEETEITKIFEEIIRMDLKRMSYNVEITEIERIRKFGVTAKIITTYEFMKKYLTIWNLEDEELDNQILQWRVENTKECERCEIERLKKEFKIGKETCIECEKDIEKENPTDDEDEVEEDIKEPEIGSSKKPKSKEKNKELKKTPIIPITPVIPVKLKITMAASRDELRADLRALMNTIGAIVEIPAFYGTSGEDPEEWASKFEKAFTVNGLGNDDTQRFIIAKARLMGEQQIG
ncbi:hypothetical protein GLOIN_2v1784231 [Rhizophagus irregularis DAOM 181602=DAOM 197198]|uniref:Uncharacterized protein n=1 Tax=Rhizophagus irregularis (strain DAOM 181602 / DAOM 197198 / MUCL 43194) TaxID=747089 RepID=A0A2P4PD36_RHIID|nr:hypothetical protein GLOIN_2v1784231 [Rhizophagus irregularis DAOM 181602=DAOM 197198]POG63293.1 hypothetical protein GLOIN_2v1784231 [Rhizophagus irregularis DAOM 181602=DAOM 197198]|eukprot:XP_025170159.1 hypothetical protein GLOIN_2v1784231 [Rhizophagus irregularis DAOM 181602=DAOM 197198]